MKDLEKVVEVFDELPAEKILEVAQDVQKKLQTDQSLEQQEKGEDEWGWVTKADTEIQKMILDYFKNSSLAGTYKIIAEEKFEDEGGSEQKSWQLVIDPLDGTSAFRKGKETWGVMIGACDEKGVLQYSWNLVSSGDVYKIDLSAKSEKKSFAEKVASGAKVAIDVYDYKSGASEKFGEIFEGKSSFKSDQYEQTSYPAAIWAGWELYQGNLDGLLWVPSDKGKKWYPDYDLIFLGALLQQGFKMRLAKIEGNIAIVVIAPSDEDVDSLYNIGCDMITDEQKKIIEIVDSPLQITNSL